MSVTTTPAMWARLAGQEHAVRLLRTAVESNATSHAYVFAGPEGVGRTLAALALAASLNCADGGCGSCGVCQRILRRVHPDVHVIAPEGAQLLVDQVREVMHAAARSPLEGRTKMFIFEDAHRMNPAAANALLKMLEEPPGDVVFVLVTASPEDLLPTVVSRSRRVDFSPLGPRAIAEVLVEQHGAEPARAAWAARTAGDLSAALRFVKDPDAPARHASHLEIPGRLVRGGVGAAVECASEIAEEAAAAGAALAKKHKEEVKALAESMGDARGTASIKKRLEDRHKREQRRRETEAFDSALRDIAAFYRDVLAAAAGAPDDALINVEIAERVRRAAAVADPAWLLNAVRRIDTVRLDLTRNVVPILALESLFAELGTPRARR